MENPTDNIVTGEDIEPDESRTPTEFASGEWMSLEQVAKHFGCSAIQVRDWVASGMLTPEPFGSTERVRRSEVMKIGNPDAGAAKEFEKEHQE
ncbi:MAG: helix-turn-helix domain-containing protein [Abitibacteriaceae bacterium]|nr:helix-turn-helix domain-containing protein [Abditibacteriaceae bacterium]